MSTSRPSAHRWYVLGVLTVVYVFNISDRYVISTLIEPIKADLGLSDSSVGFLTGTALAIVYTGMGIPLARLADRGNRRKLLTIAIALWSLMTAACGQASSFGWLIAARVGVGLGEAGATPASQSLLADLFAFAERLPAMAVYAVGAAVGSLLGGSVGGLVADAWGWRAAFLTLAVPSLAMAPLVWLTVNEPRCGDSTKLASVAAQPLPARYVSLGAVVAFARSQPALLHTLLGGTVCTLWSWGLLWWTPAFLSRSHGFSTGRAGLLLGLINGIGGTVGVLMGAWLIQRVGRRDPRFQCWSLALIVGVATIASIIAYTTTRPLLMEAMMCVFVPVAYLHLAPVFGWIQSLAPSSMRAMFCAIFLFGANIANLAIAPQVIGYGSDFLLAHTQLGTESLRAMLIATAFTGFWAAAHFWATGARFTQDLTRVGVRVEATQEGPFQAVERGR